MGKASKWFRAVLGLKKPNPSPPPPPPPTHSPPLKDKPRTKWPFIKSYRNHHYHHHQQPTQRAVSYEEDPHDPNTHAIAVAAATAAVAEAAVAAAHAAAEVVRLTSIGRCPATYAGGSPEAAAVKIQAAFRGYLARRALRALKALVRLQALVRGYIERKRTTEWLQRMQVLLRAQARARAGRIQVSESSVSNSSCKTAYLHHPGPPTPEKFEHAIRTKSGKYDQSFMLKRNGSKSNSRTSGDQDKTQSSSNWLERRIEERSHDQLLPSRRAGVVDEEKSDKILEIDPGKFNMNYKRGKHFHPTHHSMTSEQYTYSYSTSKDTITHQTVLSPSSGEVQSLSPLKFSSEIEEAFCTADNSPQFLSASSMGGSGKRSPFTPTKSDGSRSFLSGYSYCPNYMSFTESSKAKARSVSAPKQRPQYERSSSAKRSTINFFAEPRSSSAQRASALRTNFVSKAYPGSGRLDGLGMPIGQRY